MITSNLYEQVFTSRPKGADELHAVAGYATPAMVSRLVTELDDVRVHVLVGMVGVGGISTASHFGFVKLLRDHPSRLTLHYVLAPRSVHSKVYVWSRHGDPVAAFAGSSNLTQRGFLLGDSATQHAEVLVPVDPTLARSEVDALATGAASASSSDIVDRITFVPGPREKAASARRKPHSRPVSVVLPLVASRAGSPGTVRGGVHMTWGLNWGQNRERTDRDEAVIPFPKAAKDYAPGFFPIGVAHSRPQFLVATDDGDVLVMAVAEADGKALHSLPSNGDMGRYFRHRLGVETGKAVTTDHLRAFGSRFVRLTKIDEEEFYLEYGPGLEQLGERIYGF